MSKEERIVDLSYITDFYPTQGSVMEDSYGMTPKSVPITDLKIHGSNIHRIISMGNLKPTGGQLNQKEQNHLQKEIASHIFMDMLSQNTDPFLGLEQEQTSENSPSPSP